MITIWREENIVTLHATKNHNEDIMIIAMEKWFSEMWLQNHSHQESQCFLITLRKTLVHHDFVNSVIWTLKEEKQETHQG